MSISRTFTGLVKAAAWAGRFLLAASIAGIVWSAYRCVAGQYVSQGMWALVGVMLDITMGRVMAWGLLAAVAAFFLALALGLLPDRGKRAVALTMFLALFAVFGGLLLAIVSAGVSKGLPDNYIEAGVTVLIGNVLWPAFNLGVSSYEWNFWALILIVAGASLAASVAPVWVYSKLRGLKPADAAKEQIRAKSLWPLPAAFGAWGFALVLSWLLTPSPPAGAPSVLLVSIDTLRADHLGCYGYSEPTSPVLDELAGHGVVFEQAVALSPYTLPSHVTMLTGLHPMVHGVTKLTNSIPERTVLLGELFAAKGYSTGAVVSNPLLGPSFGFDQGFAYYEYNAEGTAGPAIESAERFLERNAGEPFFLFLHLFDPHHTYDAPDQDKELFRGADAEGFCQEIPFYEFRDKYRNASAQQRSDLVAAYDAEIHFSDRMLGRLLDKARELGVYEDLLVVVTSDHGEEFWDHGGLGHTVTLYDELLRVPLIVRFPGDRFAGGRVGAQVRLSDLPAFVAARAELSLPELSEGRDFIGLLASEDLLEPQAATGFTDMFGPARYCRRTVDLKWISQSSYKYGEDVEIHAERLFDLESDPLEQHNLALEEAELTELTAESNREEIQVLNDLSKVQGASDVHELDPATIERLRSLGYLQ